MIFFDLDGTLLDQKHAQNLGCEFLYKKYGFSRKDNLIGFLAKWDQLTKFYYDLYLKRQCTYEEQRVHRIIDLFQFYNIEMNGINPLQYYNEYLQIFESSWTLYDDVTTSLNALHSNYKLGIITNGDVTQQTQKLENTGIINYFSTIVAAGEFDFSKPDPRIFTIACDRAAVKYDECCYVGDSYRTDILPCKMLGIYGIYINRAGKSVNDSEIIQIDLLTDIPNYIKQL